MRRLMSIVVLFICGCSTAVPPMEANDPDPFVFLENAELTARIARAPLADDLSFDSLLNAGEHSALMVHRDGTGDTRSR